MNQLLWHKGCIHIALKKIYGDDGVPLSEISYSVMGQ